ncbi:MAG: hypothetical protein V1796_02650 [Pseudomonadota bacterium]
MSRQQRNDSAILMAEQDAQDAQSALRMADRVYVLEYGRIGHEGASAELAADDYIHQARVERDSRKVATSGNYSMFFSSNWNLSRSQKTP